MIGSIKNIFYGLFMMTVAFSYSVFMMLQAAFGFSIAGGVFQIYNFIVTFIVAVVYLLNFPKISKRILTVSFIVPLFFIILFILTGLYYGDSNSLHTSHLLSMGSRFLPAMMMGGIMAVNKNTTSMIEKALFPFMIFYTIVIARIVFSVSANDFLSATNMEAYRQEETGLGYQALSYYSTFAYCMTLYLLVYGENYGKILKKLLIACAFLQIYLCISSGGRGALVLAIVFSFYYGIRFFSWQNLFLYISFLFLIYYFSSIFLLNDGRFEHGFNRLFNFFGNKNAIENDNRWYRWNLAWNAFCESPIYGNGIGSVFYKIKFYSHNIFSDILCEGGVILFAYSIYLLKKFYSKSKLLISENSQNEIFIMIFICSFINLLFSGYYFSDSAIWFSLSYVFCII